MVEFDSETLFDAAAAVVSTIAAVFFIVGVEYGYSPVSKGVIVFTFLTGIFAITQRTADRRQTVLGYGVIVVTAVALLFEVVERFDVDDLVTVAGLLALAALLFVLRTRLDDEHRFVSGGRATAAFGAVAALAIIVLLIDIGTGGLAYELQPASEIVFENADRDEHQIGSLVVRNPTPFVEPVRAPRYAACAAGNWSAYRATTPGEPPRAVDLHVNVRDGYNEFVVGYGTKTFPVELHLHGANLEGARFPVQLTSSCPNDGTGTAYVALYEEPRR